MRIFLIILLFLFIGALVIVSNGNLHLKEKIETRKFANLYYSWLLNMGENLIKTTGYIVKFEWMPNKNNTFVENITK